MGLLDSGRQLRGYEDMTPDAHSAPDYAQYYADNAPAPGQTSFGGSESAADNEIGRYRAMGAVRQPAAQLDQTQANESRGLQMNALEMLRAQAEGTAPSSAAILSQRANENAARNAGMAAAGARSTGGAIAASRAAGDMAGQAALSGNAQNANERGAELSHGQASYAGGTGAVNAADIGAATSNAGFEAQQHALDQGRQQGFERLGWNTRNAQLQGKSQQHQQFVSGGNAAAAAGRAETEAKYQKGKDIASGALSLLSDERTKMHVVPVGSLSSLMRGRR